MQLKFGKDDRLSGSLLEGDRDVSIIIAHGFGVDSSQGIYKNLSEELNEQGFNCLRFDFAGCGKSEGNSVDRCFESEISDLKEAKKVLEEKYKNSKIILVGHSRGATTALLFSLEKEAEGIVACCPVENLTQGWSEEEISKIEREGYLEEGDLKVGKKMWGELKNYQRTSKIASRVDINSLLVLGEVDDHNNKKEIEALSKHFDRVVSYESGHYLNKKLDKVAKEISQWIEGTIK